jgi:type IV pilus assembly protein PilA
MRSSRQSGFTLIELLIVVALIGILAALSAPFMMAAKASANEASAISTLKALNSGQTAFAGTCGSGSYSTSVNHLIALEYVGSDLSLAPKSGFTLTLGAGMTSTPGPTDCGGSPTVSAYYASAVSMGAQLRRGFATNQGGIVWEDRTGVAPTEPFTTTATVSPIQ